ncbi:thermonuclease family protein [Aestuariivirga sp.]|uniref:thermonuclease family protein n=1 Tax=Aestuariivirga sp. TaxID=2650926 RepID=UPI0039E31B97
MAFLAALALAAIPAHSETVSGPAYVIDGDTLDVSGVRVRLYGIDAAESRQRCVAPGRKFVRPGDQAIAQIGRMAKGGIACQGSEHDQYGRLLAVCVTAQGEDINRALVRQGFAWAFVRYSTTYLAEQKQAQAEGLGIWQMACDTPWDFREKRWEATAQKAVEGCPIKGNISGNGRIYHMPWDRFYASTKIDTSKGERWFCNEAEAQAAGWRRARQ